MPPRIEKPIRKSIKYLPTTMTTTSFTFRHHIELERRFLFISRKSFIVCDGNFFFLKGQEQVNHLTFAFLSAPIVSYLFSFIETGKKITFSNQKRPFLSLIRLLSREINLLYRLAPFLYVHILPGVGT